MFPVPSSSADRRLPTIRFCPFSLGVIPRDCFSFFTSIAFLLYPSMCERHSFPRDPARESLFLSRNCVKIVRYIYGREPCCYLTIIAQFVFDEKYDEKCVTHFLSRLFCLIFNFDILYRTRKFDKFRIAINS